MLVTPGQERESVLHDKVRGNWARSGVHTHVMEAAVNLNSVLVSSHQYET